MPEEKSIEVPTKFNPATQKYEPDLEKLDEKVDELNREVKQKDKLAEKKPKISEDKPGKKGEGSFMPIFIILIASMLIAFYWEKLPFIKNSVHFVLNPSAGTLLSWNLSWGMLIIVFAITILTTVVQKYATDQKTLKELKKEQKELQKQMKDVRSHPEKYMELQKKSFPLAMKQMKLSMRAMAFTGIPFILFFRWFSDYFVGAGNPKFWFGMSWFVFYLIFALIFGAILRKWWDVV